MILLIVSLQECLRINGRCRIRHFRDDLALYHRGSAVDSIDINSYDNRRRYLD